MKAFEVTSGIPAERYSFAEVYMHNVHKNFYQINPDENMKNFGIRSTD